MTTDTAIRARARMRASGSAQRGVGVDRVRQLVDNRGGLVPRRGLLHEPILTVGRWGRRSRGPEEPLVTSS